MPPSTTGRQGAWGGAQAAALPSCGWLWWVPWASGGGVGVGGGVG